MTLKEINHNYNVIENHTSSNLTVDEVTWIHGGCVHAPDVLMKRIEGKPYAEKGGQIVISCDAKLLMPQAHRHRNKINNDEWFAQKVPEK